MSKSITLFSVILIMSLGVNAQSYLEDIRVDKLYCCNLRDVFKTLENDLGLSFEYDGQKMKEFEYAMHPWDKPLNEFLESLCKKRGLKYYLSDDSVIHIVDKWYNVEQSVMESKKSHTQKATRSNILISGKTQDSETHESLPFVTIYIKSNKNGTSSNLDGYFTLLNTPTDTSTIVFSYIGYKTKEIYLSPKTDFENMTIELQPEVQTLGEVTVTSERQDILQVSRTQPGIIKMSPKKLNTLPNLGEKDILRSFQLMPGISAANENSSGLYVRGGTPDQVLMLYDGFTVYNVEHMFGFFSAFNSNAIKDVQLFKGGFNSKYGGRLASVVEITGKEGNQKKSSATVDLSMMSANAFVEFPLGEKFTGVIAARRSWKSPLYDKIFEQFTEENQGGMMGRMGGRPGGEMEQETSSYFYDLNGKFTLRPTNKDIITLSIYNGMDNLDNSIVPGGERAEQMNLDMESIDLTKWGNTGASLKWSRKQSSKLYVYSLLSFSNYFSTRERSTSGSFRSGDSEGSISRGILEDNNLLDFSSKLDFEYKLADNHQLGFGLHATLNDINYEYTQNDTSTIISRSSNGEILSGYLEDKIELLGDNLKLTPGLRYNYFSETAKSYFEPRLMATYELTERIRLKASIGDYYQFAKRVIREDIAEGSRDFWVLSDDDKLPVSFSRQYVLGASYETEKFLFDVEGFYKDMDNITEYSLRIEPGPGGINYSENFFTGTGKAKGIDFLLQKKTGNITGWLGYTISQVTNHIDAFGDYDFYASHDVTNEFKAVLSYKWRKWDFGATWIYATGKPYTAPEGGYQLTLLDGTVQDYINVTVKNGERLPDYHRLDLSAKYNFKLGKNSPASIGLSLFNTYNRSNVWYKEYEIIDNTIIETPVYYLGLTPNLNLTIKLW